MMQQLIFVYRFSLKVIFQKYMFKFCKFSWGKRRAYFQNFAQVWFSLISR